MDTRLCPSGNALFSGMITTIRHGKTVIRCDRNEQHDAFSCVVPKYLILDTFLHCLLWFC